MKKLIIISALALACVVPTASARNNPIPVPGGPFNVRVDMACVAAGNPVVFCIIR